MLARKQAEEQDGATQAKGGCEGRRTTQDNYKQATENAVKAE
jgi:hypothetical protein